ncbi:DUF3667 domain-containing protein [Qipengyuania sediminis]|uniref:DUF3667 domain-containing protein n=1 Tax=Qipengyuania sediminis TaxID=1532023 RepID=UPI00105A4237|nr:DUF3667 domain-containing protein [Qipengyuania sediminis]
MNEIADAVGTTVAGGVVARAVEPSASGYADASPKGHTRESACLNCGTALIGAHCHSCGQRAHLHRTLGAFAHDLLHGVLHFEGKTWRTLPLLAWRPGQLTREYIDGKRARYVSPIALFLFVVFLSFAIFNLMGAGGGSATGGTGVAAVEQAYQDNAAKLAVLRKEREALAPAAAARRTAIDAEIAEIEQDQKGMAVVLGKDSVSVGGEIWEGFSHESESDNGPVGRLVKHVRENPQLAIYKAQSNAYKYSWMLIPLSVPFVWMLFAFRRRYGAYDHTVFTTYSITFMIALVAVASMLFYAGWDGLGLLALLYAPFHMYRQLRGTYSLSRFSAIWRMLALSLFAWVAIALFATLIGMASA